MANPRIRIMVKPPPMARKLLPSQAVVKERVMPIPFGMFVPQGWRMALVEINDPVEQYEAMTRVALVAEESGFDSAWVYDHFHTVPTPEIETCFEAWTITAGLVRDTKDRKGGSA